mgnify:FL=1
MRPQYERVPVDQLKFDPKNSRKHDTKNIKAIKESLLKFGQQKPIVVMTDGTVIAGNGTLQAFKELLKETGQQEMWSTIDVHWSILKKSEAKAYALADNRSAELAMWDDSQLKESLEELSAEGWDLGDLGWDDADLKDVIDSEQGTEGLTDEDAVPEVEQNVFGVKLGDIWQLGNHRLMCGDSTDKATVGKLMNGEKADMVFTDPPYNIASDSKNMAAKVSKAMNELKNSEWDKNFNIESALNNLEPFIENGSIYVWCSHFLFHRIMEHLKTWTKFQGWCIWSKPNPMPSLMKRHWTWNMEICCYATIGKHTFNAPESAHALACWPINKKSDGTHPTQKPIELCEHVITHSSNKSHLIMDIFLGSGSTLIACEKTGRKCYGMELDPHYCSVIIKRWQDFTGKTASLVTLQSI